MYSIKEICNAIGGKFLLQNTTNTIEHIAIDSRKISFARDTLFFALQANRRDGQDYLAECYAKGVRNFVVHKKVNVSPYEDATIILVKNTIAALQQLAIFHRNSFQNDVIGITGSNGKTIVKEWLYQLLYKDFSIVRSPKSYNSQIGVPLSIWNIHAMHNLAIFEAGISTCNEMNNLQKMIQPTIGILTNIGNAHNEGFANMEQKLQEKLILFKECKTLIYNTDNVMIKSGIAVFIKHNPSIQYISWGKKADNVIQVKSITSKHHKTIIVLLYNAKTYTLHLPFTDAASIENGLHCIALLCIKKYNEKQIQTKLKELQPVAMRLEQKKGTQQCIIINDSYSNDITSLQIALDYINQQNPQWKKTIVITDVEQSGQPAPKLYKHVAKLLKEKNIEKLIGIGLEMVAQKQLFKNITETHFFATNDEAISFFLEKNFYKEVILFKGARSFAIEKLAALLEEKVHQTILEISIEKLIHNIKAHQHCIAKNTKIMAIVKAFGYGNGATEVSNVLQSLNIDYLAVAYADEGVALRKAGIYLPIMVMNVDVSAFGLLIEHNLEPEIYSFGILNQFLDFAKKNTLTNYPIHIKLDTGMHRLGFEEEEMNSLLTILCQHNAFKVQSIFSHLVASEDKTLDNFTKKQNSLFCSMSKKLETGLGYTILKHLANTSAIERHPDLQHNMVRLGIGMYGVTKNNIGLQQVCTLKTTIAQIKLIKKGDTVGYNRKGKVQRNSKIATVRIGYADGYNRKLGNGIGKMLINNMLVPTIGNICMDMTMIDITDIPNVNEGDYVTVFGDALLVQELATWSGTIPYEILTGISQRVKRIYYD